MLFKKNKGYIYTIKNSKGSDFNYFLRGLLELTDAKTNGSSIVDVTTARINNMIVIKVISLIDNDKYFETFGEITKEEIDLYTYDNSIYEKLEPELLEDYYDRLDNDENCKLMLFAKV